MYVLAFVLIPFSPLISFFALILMPITLVGIRLFIDVNTINIQSPTSHELMQKHSAHIEYIPLAQFDKLPSTGYEAISTMDAIESNKLKLEMLKAAKHNIVISGCYCGGEIFDNALEIIEGKLEENPNLEVFIITSSMWLTPSNDKKLFQIGEKYRNNFTYVVTKEKNFSINLDSKEIKITCNHTKALVIDYGRYFMIGGSGLQDLWAKYSGFESIKRPPVPFYLKLAKESMAPLAFHDSDFLVYCPTVDSVGKTMYIEMMKLITRWQTTQRKIHHFAIQKLPKTLPDEVDSYVAAFHERKDKTSELSLAVYLSSPEHHGHKFLDELVKGVNKAKRCVYINHLYFHPPKELLDALIDASNRGVEIVLITNKNGMNSPGMHFLFTALSQKNYKKIFEGRKKPNVQVYEFNVENVTLHKKIVIIDEQSVFAGSSNIGYTSMTREADYELDMVVHSKKFAKDLYQKLRKDHEICSLQVDSDTVYIENMQTRFLAPLQSTFEFLF